MTSEPASTTAWESAPGVVLLPDGRSVRGTAMRRARDGGVAAPDAALYLLGRPPGPVAWAQYWIRWPDFGLPHSSDDAVGVLRDVHWLAADRRVEVCCGGGVGRTGTAIAALAILSGLPPPDAVRWVRQAYHPRAVETPWQRHWLRTRFPT